MGDWNLHHHTITNSSCLISRGSVVSFSHRCMRKCALFKNPLQFTMIWDILFRLIAYLDTTFGLSVSLRNTQRFPLAGWKSLNKEEANAMIFGVKNNHEIDSTVSKKYSIQWGLKVEWRDRGNEGVSRHDSASQLL